MTREQITLLRLEDGAKALAGLWIFAQTGESWWLFVLLILAPDISFLGYRAGPRVGAAIYNAAHSYLGALALLGLGLATSPLVLALGAILWTHIAVDRALGFGLKSPEGFKHTHLGRL